MLPLVAFVFGVVVQLAVVTHVLFICKREKEIVPVYYPRAPQQPEEATVRESQPAAQNQNTAAAAPSAEQNQSPQAAEEPKKVTKPPPPGQVNRYPQVVYVNRPYSGGLYGGGYYRPYYGGYYGSYGGYGSYDSCGLGFGGFGYGSCSPCYTSSCCW